MLHKPFQVNARVIQLASPGDFMNTGNVRVEWEKVEKKKKSMVQRWCDPKDLELVRTSPRKAARVSGVVGRAPSKTSHRPGINGGSGSDSDLELAPHEKGRQLPQALRCTGMGTAHGTCGVRAYKTKVLIPERVAAFPNDSLKEVCSALVRGACVCVWRLD